MGSLSSTKYYPDWHGDNESCLIDNSSTPAPQYMRVGNTWFSDTLDECCEKYYQYNTAGCKGSGGIGSNKYYVNWDTFKCVRDCAIGSGLDCGGFSDRDWGDEEFDDKSECCSTYLSWDYKECMSL